MTKPSETEQLVSYHTLCKEKDRRQTSRIVSSLSLSLVPTTQKPSALSCVASDKHLFDVQMSIVFDNPWIFGIFQSDARVLYHLRETVKRSLSVSIIDFALTRPTTASAIFRTKSLPKQWFSFAPNARLDSLWYVFLSLDEAR